MASNMTNPAAAQAALQAEIETLLTLSADYRLTRGFWSEPLALYHGATVGLTDWLVASMVVVLYDWSTYSLCHKHP